MEAGAAFLIFPRLYGGEGAEIRWLPWREGASGGKEVRNEQAGLH